MEEKSLKTLGGNKNGNSESCCCHDDPCSFFPSQLICLSRFYFHVCLDWISWIETSHLGGRAADLSALCHSARLRWTGSLRNSAPSLTATRSASEPAPPASIGTASIPGAPPTLEPWLQADFQWTWWTPAMEPASASSASVDLENGGFWKQTLLLYLQM